MPPNRWAIVTGMAIVAITTLETSALLLGVDGVALSASIAGIAALGGATARQLLGK